MRTLATVMFHLMNWLRGPILIVLGLARFFFFLGLLAVVVAFVAVPAQHDTIYKLLAIGLVGSFGAYLMRRGYDRALYKLNLFRLTATR